jgi:hypothetical protein
LRGYVVDRRPRGLEDKVEVVDDEVVEVVVKMSCDRDK